MRRAEVDGTRRDGRFVSARGPGWRPWVMAGLLGGSALGCFAVSPARAQWSRVTEVPLTEVYSVWVKGDTIAAGLDTAACVSTDGGATWKRSARVAANVTAVRRVRVHNGRLYAGTFGQGVFISPDLGDTWAAFNQGLAGGLFDSHLFIKDLLVHDGRMIAATSGAGPYVRNLETPGTWSHFGNVFEPNAASNMQAVAGGGTRLLACAGANGMVFFRDAASADWTRSWLDNRGVVAGLSALDAAWTGSRWVVGTNAGLFHSELGQSPWTFSDLGPGPFFSFSFGLRGSEVWALIGAGDGSTHARSSDGGVTWHPFEFLPAVFTFGIAIHGDVLYAARIDGLWRRSLAAVSTPEPAAPVRLGIAVSGSHLVQDHARFRFELPRAGRAVIEVFDIGGRRAGGRIEGVWPAGVHETGWSAGRLAPGVYHARLTSAGRSAVVRLIRVR